MQYSGAGGKLIHQKNQKQKISWHCPFKKTTTKNIPRRLRIRKHGLLCKIYTVMTYNFNINFHCFVGKHYIFMFQLFEFFSAPILQLWSIIYKFFTNTLFLFV